MTILNDSVSSTIAVADCQDVHLIVAGSLPVFIPCSCTVVIFLNLCWCVGVWVSMLSYWECADERAISHTHALVHVCISGCQISALEDVFDHGRGGKGD